MYWQQSNNLYHRMADEGCFNKRLGFHSYCLLFRHNYVDRFRDNVEWDSEQEQQALKKITENSAVKIESQMRGTICTAVITVKLTIV